MIKNSNNLSTPTLLSSAHLSKFTNGHTPPTLLARTRLSGVHSYYRSKIFNSQGSQNRLVGAATALLTLLIRIEKSSSAADTITQQHLAHEINAFETMAYQNGYRSETILVARYALCAVLDEAFSYQLLDNFHKESWGGERFFLILDRIMEDPKLHIDLLELMYFCLSLGFEGKYREISDGLLQREKMIDTLYQMIRQQRGDVKKALLIDESSAFAPKPTLTLPLWLIPLLSGALLLTIHTGFNYLSTLASTPAYQQLLALQSL